MLLHMFRMVMSICLGQKSVNEMFIPLSIRCACNYSFSKWRKNWGWYSNISLLIQYSELEAGQYIEECIIIRSNEGYETKMKLSNRWIVQNYMVTLFHIKRRQEGPPFLSNYSISLVHQMFIVVVSFLAVEL